MSDGKQICVLNWIGSATHNKLLFFCYKEEKVGSHVKYFFAEIFKKLYELKSNSNLLFNDGIKLWDVQIIIKEIILSELENENVLSYICTHTWSI